MDLISIHSNQFLSGTPYDGVWLLDDHISGTFTLQSEYMTQYDIPWIWKDVNQLKYELEINRNHKFEHYTRIVQLNHNFLAFAKDLRLIMFSILDVLNTDFSLIGSLITVDGNYDEYNLILFINSPFVFNFSILWEDWDCTASGVFGKEYNETTSILYLPVSYMITQPQFLEVCIVEADDFYISSSINSDRLLFPFVSGHIPGQKIVFDNETNTLTIKFYRRNIHYSPVPFNNTWDMFLLSDLVYEI
jgi:hypothetical protein